MIDYTKILQYKYPDSKWTLNGDDYDGLTWLSDTAKPSKTVLDKLWPEVQQMIQAEAEAKVQAKASAEAKLAALGLNANDLKALGL
jgi:hypothetical protein